MVLWDGQLDMVMLNYRWLVFWCDIGCAIGVLRVFDGFWKCLVSWGLSVLYRAPLQMRPPEGCPSYRTGIPADAVAVDVWSIGMLALNCLLWKSLHLLMPRYSESWVDDIYPVLFYLLKKKEIWNRIREKLPGIRMNCCTFDNLCNFVHSCLHIHPNERPTADQVLEHKFLGRGSYWGEVDIKWIHEAVPGEIEVMMSRFELRQRRLLLMSESIPRDVRETPLTIVSYDGSVDKGVVKLDPRTGRFQIMKDDRSSSTPEIIDNRSTVEEENQEQVAVENGENDGRNEHHSTQSNVNHTPVPGTDDMELERIVPNLEEDLQTPPDNPDWADRMLFGNSEDLNNFEEEINVPKKKKRRLARFAGWLRKKVSRT